VALSAALVKTADIAKSLGVNRLTVIKWCDKLGIPMIKSPVANHDEISFRHAHRYLTIPNAVRLIDAMLPGMAMKLERDRLVERTKRQARETTFSHRNVAHVEQACERPADMPPPLQQVGEAADEGAEDHRDEEK
jgi:hypothetical protein